MTPPLNLPPLLASNLRALAHADRMLAIRLCEPVISDHLVGDPPEYHLNRSTYRLALRPEEVAAQLEGAAGRCLVVGIGLGEVVCAAIDAGLEVTVWERDPALVRAALSRCDLSRVIREGQLSIIMGVDLTGIQLGEFDAVLHHPLLGQVYARDLRMLRAGIGARRALICEGGLFVDDVADALEAEGLSVYTWDIHRLSPKELDRVVARFDPEVIFSINHTHGLAEACHRLGRPLVVWEIDPSTDQLRECPVSATGTHIFTYRKQNVPRFQAAGFQDVRYFPLAANTLRRCPGEVAGSSEASGQVCFVGASMVDQAQKFREIFREAWAQHGGDPLDGIARLDQVLAEQRRLGGSYQIPALVQAAMGDFVRDTRQKLPHDLTALVAEMAAAERRLNVVARLGSLGVHVWGDPGWRVTEAHGARYMGYAGHDRALTQIYRAGAVHVDVARIYQQDIVPMRIFDILACGGFVLAEHSPALESLFELGKDLESWRTIDELQAKVRHFMTHRGQAAQIGQHGMETVRRSHSIQARIRTMLNAVGDAHPSRSVV